MKLLTKDIRDKLLSNGRHRVQAQDLGDPEPDFPPVVKLFTYSGSATWLLTELDPEDPDLAFGLCDLGFGFPELGYVRISELESARDVFGMNIVERDRFFTAERKLSAYAAEARLNERIVA